MSEKAHIDYLHKLYNSKNGDGEGSGDFTLTSIDGQKFLVHSLLFICRHIFEKLSMKYHVNLIVLGLTSLLDC